jgi:CheY-like chemotaxis protein
MPVMDGWTFMDYLSQRPGRVAPQIIVTTGQATPSIAGVCAVLRKPIDADELLKLIQQL